MSQNRDGIKYQFAAGVFKWDYTVAGYKDLMELAQEWAKDENFYSIIVRTVSPKNWGIQFIYISNTADQNHIKKHKESAEEKLGKMYAYDFQDWDYGASYIDNFSKSLEQIVTLKPFDKENFLN